MVINMAEQQPTRRRVDVFVTDDNGKVLAGKDPQDNVKNRVEVPGGGVEEDESVEQAAKREVAEETGYTVKAVKTVGQRPVHESNPGQDEQTYWRKAQVTDKEPNSSRKGDDGDVLSDLRFEEPGDLARKFRHIAGVQKNDERRRDAVKAQILESEKMSAFEQGYNRTMKIAFLDDETAGQRGRRQYLEGTGKTYAGAGLGGLAGAGLGALLGGRGGRGAGALRGAIGGAGIGGLGGSLKATKDWYDEEGLGGTLGMIGGGYAGGQLGSGMGNVLGEMTMGHRAMSEVPEAIGMALAEGRKPRVSGRGLAAAAIPALLGLGGGALGAGAGLSLFGNDED